MPRKAQPSNNQKQVEKQREREEKSKAKEAKRKLINEKNTLFELTFSIAQPNGSIGPGVLSRTIKGDGDNIYYKYALIGKVQQLKQTFADGYIAKVQQGNFAAELERNTEWTKNVLPNLSKLTDTYDVSVAKYRVVEVENVQHELPEQYKNNVLTLASDDLGVSKSDADWKGVAVKVRKFELYNKWFHNDLQKGNIVVGEDGKIRLIDVLPFSQFGVDNDKAEPEKCVEGTARFLYIQQVVQVAELAAPPDLQRLYRKYNQEPEPHYFPCLGQLNFLERYKRLTTVHAQQLQDFRNTFKLADKYKDYQAASDQFTLALIEPSKQPVRPPTKQRLVPAPVRNLTEKDDAPVALADKNNAIIGTVLPNQLEQVEGSAKKRHGSDSTGGPGGNSRNANPQTGTKSIKTTLQHTISTLNADAAVALQLQAPAQVTQLVTALKGAAEQGSITANVYENVRNEYRALAEAMTKYACQQHADIDDESKQAVTVAYNCLAELYNAAHNGGLTQLTVKEVWNEPCPTASKSKRRFTRSSGK